MVRKPAKKAGSSWELSKGRGGGGVHCGTILGDISKLRFFYTVIMTLKKFNF